MTILMRDDRFYVTDGDAETGPFDSREHAEVFAGAPQEAPILDHATRLVDVPVPAPIKRRGRKAKN